MNFSPQTILDPGAGDGVWGRAARTRWPQSLIAGVELRAVPQPAGFNFWYSDDYLRMTTAPAFDLIIGNPPYKLAESFVRQSLANLADGGYLVFLLPLGFLAGKGRFSGLYSDFPPERVAICAGRPSFTGNGKTDAHEYAVFYWRKVVTQRDPVLSWITFENDKDGRNSEFSGIAQMRMFDTKGEVA